MTKQQKNKVTESHQLEDNHQSFFEGLNEYLNSYRGDSAFVDAFCTARDKYNKAVILYPKTDQEKKQKKELLEEALREAKNCCNIQDWFSQSIIPNGLIMAIEQEINKLN